MGLEKIREFVKGIEQKFSFLEIGPVYESLSEDEDGIREQVKILDIYDLGITSIPENLKGKIKYGVLGSDGQIVKEVVVSEEDFKDSFVKLPKGISV